MYNRGVYVVGGGCIENDVYLERMGGERLEGKTGNCAILWGQV